VLVRARELLNWRTMAYVDGRRPSPSKHAAAAAPGAPTHRTALDSRFLDADGSDRRLLRPPDDRPILERAEPLGGPGTVSPRPFGARRSEKATDAALAVWSDSGEVEDPVDLNEGAG